MDEKILMCARHARLCRRALAVICGSMILMGCGGAKPTDEQRSVFMTRVAPEVERLLRVLEATNASPVSAARPIRAADLVWSHATLETTLWDVCRDKVSYTLEMLPSEDVNLTVNAS